MIIIEYSENLHNNIESSVITVGNFDGVHRGHQEIFRRVVAKARRLGVPSLAITFDPHPLTFMDPDRAPLLLTLHDEKAYLIEECGIDILVSIPFDKEISMMSAREFVERILCLQLGMRHLVIGHDYAFGRNREGNFSFLEHVAQSLGYTLEDTDPVGDGQQVFSSSGARSLLLNGNVCGAATLLGRKYFLRGKVVHGREIGRSIGFPTANLSVDRRKLIPADGVYAVTVTHGENKYNAACTIGTNPTFDGNARSIEVFLLDFTGDLYENELRLEFAERIRDIAKFHDVSALTAQIRRDVEQCRNILKGWN